MPEEAEASTDACKPYIVTDAKLKEAALAEAASEDLILATDGAGKYLHVAMEASTCGTPFVACVPVDRRGCLNPTGSVRRSGHRLSRAHRRLSEHACEEEAALASSRFLREYHANHFEALSKGLIGDSSCASDGGGSRSFSLVGQLLDFYW